MPRSRRVFIVALVIASGLTWRLADRYRYPRIERVVLLGFDGAAPNLIAPLLREGKLPAIRRLTDEGASGPLKSARPTKSAILWNSIATGKTMIKHGIVDWTYVNQQGLSVPYQDRKRRVKTYWEILEERGLSTGTLNWWVSHPPFPVPHGFVVSNAFKARADAATVHPPDLFPSLDALRWHYPGDVVPVMKRLGIPEWREEDATIPITNTRSILQSYGYYVAQDLTIDRASDWLWQNRPVQVFSTYFRLVDVTSHLADHYLTRALYDDAIARERAGTFDAQAEARLDADFARVLRPLYELMDSIVAKYIERMDGRTLLVVCSDHGFRYFQGAYSHANDAQEPPDGVVYLYGAGIRRGETLAGATLYDVAPTILYAMGQAAASDMDGTVLRAAFLPGYLRRFPVRTISSYESRPRDAGPDAASPEIENEVIRDLKTIGYIGGDAPEPSPSPTPSTSPAPRPR
jgi:predicted AlkP superfamily phosphohydrolase/phosphomutase